MEMIKTNQAKQKILSAITACFKLPASLYCILSK